MSDRTLNLLLIERDPIYCTGLRIVVEESTDLQVVGEADDQSE